MLKKIHLDQTRKFEICIATYRIAEMLVAFIQGRKHDFSVGSEQEGILGWDDLVVELENGTREHIQIKRNFLISAQIRVLGIM